MHKLVGSHAEKRCTDHAKTNCSKKQNLACRIRTSDPVMPAETPAGGCPLQSHALPTELKRGSGIGEAWQWHLFFGYNEKHHCPTHGCGRHAGYMHTSHRVTAGPAAHCSC